MFPFQQKKCHQQCLSGYPCANTSVLVFGRPHPGAALKLPRNFFLLAARTTQGWALSSCQRGIVKTSTKFKGLSGCVSGLVSPQGRWWVFGSLWHHPVPWGKGLSICLAIFGRLALDLKDLWRKGIRICLPISRKHFQTQVSRALFFFLFCF